MGIGGSRTVVIGLDGAHFELFEPWIADGELPHIAATLENGISGGLESVIPPVTSPNWKSYSTGKNPGKLGIFWWGNIDVENQSIYYPDDRKQAHTDLRELLSEDERLGVLGVPTTYPPKSCGEFLIAGAPDGENKGYAYPESLEAELEDRYEYQVVATKNIKDERDQAAEELLDLIDLRFRAATDLFEEYNLTFLQVTTFYINTLQHYFWDGEYTRRAWEQIDEHIGEFLDRDLNVVLMSDHSSTHIKYSFHINPWLESQGYLTSDFGVSNLMHRLGLTTDRLGTLASRLGVRNAVVATLPESILRRIPTESGEVSKTGKAAAVDWPRIHALASGQGPVYLTVRPEDSEYETLRTEIMEKIEELDSPDGRTVADAVHHSEAVYSGSYLDDAPDILIEQRDGVHIPDDLGRDEVFTKPSEDDWLGENKRHGLFVASGPDFGSGTVTGLSILDLAPTLLHLYGHPIPTDMDGTVRKDVFAEGSNASGRAIQRTEGDSVDASRDVTERDDAISERLEDLGYL